MSATDHNYTELTTERRHATVESPQSATEAPTSVPDERGGCP